MVTRGPSGREPTGSQPASGAGIAGVAGALREWERLRVWVDESRADVERVAALLIAALRHERPVIACGNGGSALQAQHLAAELVGRFRGERRSLPAIALSADVGVMSGIANDYGYEEVFARQLEGLGRPGDLLLLFSTSGASPNIVRACEVARAREMRTIALTSAGSRLAAGAEVALGVPSRDTARIQECHLLLLHLLCESVDAEFGSR